MFVVIFLEQWMKEKNHVSAMVGVGISLLCLTAFGADDFIIPAMVGILGVLTQHKPAPVNPFRNISRIIDGETLVTHPEDQIQIFQTVPAVLVQQCSKFTAGENAMPYKTKLKSAFQAAFPHTIPISPEPAADQTRPEAG